MMSDRKPLPRVQPVSSALLEHWLAEPTDRPVDGTLTKEELDNLYFAINNLTKAVHETQQSLIHLSNNKLDLANDAMHGAQFNTVQSTNALTRFFEGILTKHFLNGGSHGEP